MSENVDELKKMNAASDKDGFGQFTCKLVSFQAWKVCVVLWFCVVFCMVILNAIPILIEFGELTSSSYDSERFAGVVSQSLIGLVVSAVVAVPSVIILVYLIKLLLKMMGGIRVTFR